ncbi:hypothetical protein QY95_03470 [Bacillus thermotolerans]|uniref:Uncharacterized protein n=1 Tax=Bacillus thermotolerans TaxID=1221996 RepID=A0A0F5HPT9_BACTR|nr:hypothetical protein QY95_03470 [Bacillus thermotolerans]
MLDPSNALGKVIDLPPLKLLYVQYVGEHLYDYVNAYTTNTFHIYRVIQLNLVYFK